MPKPEPCRVCGGDWSLASPNYGPSVGPAQWAHECGPAGRRETVLDIWGPNPLEGYLLAGEEVPSRYRTSEYIREHLLQHFAKRVRLELRETTSAIDTPLHNHFQGVWWLDLQYNKRHVVVQYCAATDKYGISDITTNDAYTTVPDEIFDFQYDVIKRAIEMLENKNGSEADAPER